MQKSTVPPERIQNMLMQRLGHILDFHQLTEGLSSQAFGFRHGASDFVIRVNRHIEGFEKDAFVSREYGTIALPIPEVIEIGHLDDTHAFCISRRAPGVRMQDVDETEIQRIGHSVVTIMKEIAAAHVERTTGFGPFNPRGEGLYESWNNFLVSVADPRKYDWAQVGQIADMDVVKTAVESIESLAKFCPEERQLIHGDFGSFNVLTDGHQITAVIDWDLAMFGDSLYDWANLYFWNEPKLAPVMKRCEEVSEVPWYEKRLLCYQLRIGLQEIYQTAMGENPVGIDWLITRCMNVLRTNL